MNHTCLCLPGRSWYSFTDPPTDGRLSSPWVAGWLHAEINVRHRELNPDTVAHLSTNRARRRLTSLIEANALTTTPDHQPGTMCLTVITSTDNCIIHIRDSALESDIWMNERTNEWTNDWISRTFWRILQQYDMRHFQTLSLISPEKPIRSSWKFYHRCSFVNDVLNTFRNSSSSGLQIRTSDHITRTPDTQHIRTSVAIVPLTCIAFWIYNILFHYITFNLDSNFD